MSETAPVALVEGQFYRICQECGHTQTARKPDPSKELSAAYRNSKCRKCGSEALDYGSEYRAPIFEEL